MSISTNGLEDLSDLDSKLLINRALSFVFRRSGPRTRPSAQLTNNFIRLVDRAVLEHMLARVEINTFLKRRSLSSFFRAQGHLETCIQSLHRSLNFVAALKRHGLRFKDGTPLVPRGRDTEILTQPVIQKIRKIRDAIEHTEKDILKNQAVLGKPIALDVRDQEIFLCDISIQYTELGRWLREIHALAVKITNCEL